MSVNEPRVFQRNKSILLEINSSNVDNIHIIYQPVAVPSQLQPVDAFFNGFLQDLKAQVDINSLDVVSFPSLEPELTQAERFEAYTQLEWNNPRYEMQILQSLDGINWIETDRLSLQNRNPYYNLPLKPYFTSQADAILAEAWIALKVLPVDGETMSGSDRIVISGALQLQTHYFVSDNGTGGNALPTPLNIASSGSVLITNQSVLIVPANPDRKGLVLTLATAGGLYLGMGTPAVWQSGIYLAGNGASYVSDFNNLWTGEVYAIGTGTTNKRLTWAEFV